MTDRDTGLTPDLHLDCQTCLAANTTACGECIVTHVLANDDGPIGLVSTGLSVAPPARQATAIDDAVGLLARAGLLDPDPVWVDRSEFEVVQLAPLG